jgi:hypothetical protein
MFLRGDLRRAERELDATAELTRLATTDRGETYNPRDLLRQSGEHLTAAERALAAADRRSARIAPLLDAAGHLPGWPGGLSEVRPLIAVARHLTQGGRALHAGLTTMVSEMEPAEASPEPLAARAVSGLDAADADLRAAVAAFDRTLADRAAIRAERLDGPLRPGRTALQRFDEQIGTAREMLDLLRELPAAMRAIAGMDGPRTYALLGQNSAELRPTGGFIGSLGLVTVEHGKLTAEDYRSSYAFDNRMRGFEPMPPPMADHLGFTGWAVRDANWSPDFPTSAHWFEQLLYHHQGIQVDGVIGITTYGVGILLEALGPLPVEGFAEPVTAASWYGTAEQLIYFPDAGQVSADAQERKEQVLEPVLRAVLARLQSASIEEMPALLRAMRRMIRERHLLLAFHDRPAAALVRRYDADGRLEPPSGDVLAVVDANLSYSKVNLYVRQRIVYDVWLNGRGVARRSRLAVEYTNTLTPEGAVNPQARIGGTEWDAGRRVFVASPGVYGTYTRVYVPGGIRLIADPGSESELPMVGRDLGFTTLERYYRIPAGGQRGFVYTYQIPVDANDEGEYRLRVVKQPGTAGPELEVRLHVPEGTRLVANVGLADEGDSFVYRGALTANLELHAQLVDQQPD